MKQIGGIMAVVLLMTLSIAVGLYMWVLRKCYRLVHGEEIDNDWL